MLEYNSNVKIPRWKHFTSVFLDENTLYPYSLNERTKFIETDIEIVIENRDSTTGKLFSPLPRYGNTLMIPEHGLKQLIMTSYLMLKIFNFLKQFPLKYQSNELWKLLEIFKKRELNFLGRQAQDVKHNNFQKKMAWSHNRYRLSKSI